MNLSFDQLRAQEFSRLDATGHVYLDYTGGALYPESLVRAYADRLCREVLGNPHSRNPSSLESTRRIEAARERIRRFFQADSDEYEVIFTANATGALKLIGEAYPFESGSRFLLTADNHNSVNGIREYARAGGASVEYLPLGPELRIPHVQAYLRGADASKANLFAYPAQSNFSGVKHPMEWIDQARIHGYVVLLDAAAYVPANPFSLREVQPDFVNLSFYKMFGFPTGVGALIARRAALQRLRRPWFSGGTVKFASAQNKVHLLEGTAEAFEDGTLNYLSVPEVTAGLDFLDRIGMSRIHGHVMDLTNLLLEELQVLEHSNGAPMVELYGPRDALDRGATVALNVLDPSGKLVDSEEVQQRANDWNISIRTGFFCNPGAVEYTFGYAGAEAYKCFDELDPARFTLQQFSACLSDKPVGAVRVSLGLSSNRADVMRWIEFLKTFRDQAALPAESRAVPELVGG